MYTKSILICVCVGIVAVLAQQEPQQQQQSNSLFQNLRQNSFGRFRSNSFSNMPSGFGGQQQQQQPMTNELQRQDSQMDRPGFQQQQQQPGFGPRPNQQEQNDHQMMPIPPFHMFLAPLLNPFREINRPLSSFFNNMQPLMNDLRNIPDNMPGNVTDKIVTVHGRRMIMRCRTSRNNSPGMFMMSRSCSLVPLTPEDERKYEQKNNSNPTTTPETPFEPSDQTQSPLEYSSPKPNSDTADSPIVDPQRQNKQQEQQDPTKPENDLRRNDSFKA